MWWRGVTFCGLTVKKSSNVHAQVCPNAVSGLWIPPFGSSVITADSQCSVYLLIGKQLLLDLSTVLLPLLKEAYCGFMCATGSPPLLTAIRSGLHATEDW